YPIPEEAGLDKQFVPTAGLGSKVAVFALSHAHAERLLVKNPLKLDGGPLAERLKKPLAGASYFDWNGVVEALTPWVDHMAPIVIEQTTGWTLADNKKQVEGVLAQVKTVLDVLKCYKGSTSATYVEDGITVTHQEEVVSD